MSAGQEHPLEVLELSFGYARGCPVLTGISHTFEGGQVTAVVGPNGAGKSTLLKLLAGVLAPHEGRVLARGVSVGAMGSQERARRLVYIPQRSSVAFAFSVRQVVAMGRYAAGESPSTPSVLRALEATDLVDVADVPIGTLSVGQQQRVTLARAIAQLDGPEPSALLADEPISAMDPFHSVAMMQHLRRLADRGLAVVVVLHDLGLVVRGADQVLVLDARGRIAAQGPVGRTLTPDLAASVFRTPFVTLTDPLGRPAGLAPTMDAKERGVKPVQPPG